MKQNQEVQKQSVLSKGMAKTALAMSYAAANSRCVYIFHQPEAPKELEKLKKLR